MQAARDNSPSLFRSILEQMSDAVIYADNEGTIVLWNAAAAALFGYSAAEAIGRTLDLIVPAHLQGSHWRGFKRAIASGALSLQGRPTLTRTQHQSGRKLYVDMTFALVKTSGGKVRGAVGVARDVMERIEQQRATAQRESVGDA